MYVSFQQCDYKSLQYKTASFNTSVHVTRLSTKTLQNQNTYLSAEHYKNVILMSG